MAGVLLIGGLLLATSVVVVVVLLIQFLGRAEISPCADDPAVRTSLHRIRRRLGACLAAAATALVAGLVLNGMLPAWLGLPLAVAPGLAASTALWGFAISPAAPPHHAGPASASLARREAWSFGTRRSFVAPAVLALSYLVLLAVAAALASPDDLGLMRSFAQTQGNLTLSASPFPGSFYGVPLAAVTVLLVASTYAALRRLAGSATILPTSADELVRVDRRWREIATRVVVRMSTAALLGYAGGTLVLAGSAIHRATDFTINGGYATWWSAAAWVVVAAGLVGIVAATVVGGAAVGSVLSLRDQAVRPATIPTGRR